MAREPANLTLQTTALVNEAWLRLGGDTQPKWESKAQFYSAAAEAMRRILIDRARKRKRVRHGGEQKRVVLEDLDALPTLSEKADGFIALNEALEKFAQIEPEKAELVKQRYFVGLTIEEVADSMGISKTTAKRWWAFARAWLYEEITAC